ncbi:hypothetical protein GQ602_003612 [Ophiocordyceps camponoti-floridani]|uniref:Uncharacterized protein n=1 Tax=Ophiocordyceps camponoti-floridani TaxID=2030778 RepID=A0A8H4VED3_9HYPO|nr:hypothetical protein GQ602_003612 [Ophiocordyceps camponoti-floridani]
MASVGQNKDVQSGKMFRRWKLLSASPYMDGVIGMNNEQYANNKWRTTASDHDDGDSSVRPPTIERLYNMSKTKDLGDIKRPRGRYRLNLETQLVPRPTSRGEDKKKLNKKLSVNPYTHRHMSWKERIDTLRVLHTRPRQKLRGPSGSTRAVSQVGWAVNKKPPPLERSKCRFVKQKVLLPLLEQAPAFIVEPVTELPAIVNADGSLSDRTGYDVGYTCMSVRQANWTSTCKVNTYSCLPTPVKNVTFPVKVELVDDVKPQKVMAIPLLECRNLPYWNFPPTYDLICMKRFPRFQVTRPLFPGRGVWFSSASRYPAPAVIEPDQDVDVLLWCQQFGLKAVRCKSPNSHPTPEELGVTWNTPRLESLRWRDLGSIVEKAKVGEAEAVPTCTAKDEGDGG